MKKKQITDILIILLISFCFLAVCSRSSLLYPFNNWDDSNSYFSMGKALMNGKVLYRDIFDQKGPLLYLIYGIGTLLSSRTFYGIFFLELLSFSFFLAAEHKILQLYLKRITSLCLLPISAMAITASKSFYWGGSAEEFCLPLLAWGLYFSIKYFKKEYPSAPSPKIIFTAGILAGCIMLIKFTVLGFYFAWMAVIALALFIKGNIKRSIQSCLIFLGGMILPAIPWLIYFILHNSLYYWYHAYIYCNVFLYSDVYYESINLYDKIYTLAKIFYWLIPDNLIYFCFIIAGFIWVLLHKSFRWIEKINIYLLFGLLFLGIYIGGTTLYYYSLPLSLFAIYGLIPIGSFMEFILNKLSCQKNTIVISIAPGIITMLTGFILALNLSMNIEYMGQKREDFYLYKFRDIILNSETVEPTLLNISCLDAGLYTLTGIVPNCRYFQSNAVHGFDEVKIEQLKYITEQATDFIIARDYYPEEVSQYYNLVSREAYTSMGTDFTYYLFQKKQ